MRRDPNTGNASRFRTRWFVSLCVLAAFLFVGAYFLYAHRREQNTAALLVRANELKTNRNWAGAASAFRQYLQRNAEDEQAVVDYADTLLSWLDESPSVVSRSPDLVRDIVRSLRRIVRVNPAQKQYAVEHLTALHMMRGEFADAEENAGQWVVLAPTAPEPALSLARARIGRRRYVEAAAALTSAMTRMPQAHVLDALLIDLYASVDEPGFAEKAAVAVQAALSKANDSSAVHMASFRYRMRLAATSSHSEQEAEVLRAETHLDAALQLAPRSLEVVVSAADHYLSRGRIDEAEELLDREIDEIPGNNSRLLVRARWAIQTNDAAILKTTADTLFNQSQSDDLQLVDVSGELYLRARSFEQADACIDILRSVAGPGQRLAQRLGALEGARDMYQGRPYKAIPALERAVGRQGALIGTSRMLWPAQLLATAYVQVGALTEAVEVYRYILQATPKADGIRIALARVELMLGDVASAKEHARQVRKGNPELAEQASLVDIACSMALSSQAESTAANLTQSIEQLKTAVSNNPENATAGQLLADWFIRNGQPREAVNLINSFLKPTSGVAQAAMVGRKLLESGALDEARRAAEIMQSRAPNTVGTCTIVAGHRALSRSSEAVEAYISKLSLSAADKGRVWESVAAMYESAQKPASALNAARRAVELGPTSVSARTALLRRTPDLAEAERMIEQIRTIEGEDGAQWRFERARLLLQRQRSSASAHEATTLLTRCLDARPAWLSARLLLALALESSGRLDEAVDAYRAAIAQQPDLARDEVALRLVRVLGQLGRFSESDTVLSSIATALGDTPDVLRMRTESFLRSRNPASAAASAEKLLALKTDDPAWASVTAELNLRAGNLERAEQIGRQAVAAHPESAAALWSLARALILQDRPGDAEAVVRATAESHQDAQQHVVLAQLLRHLEKLEQADEAIERAAELDPESAGLNAACAAYWSARGQRARMVAFTRKAIDLRGENPKESLALANVLASGPATQRSEASEIVARRLDLDATDVSALVLKAQLASASTPPDLSAAKKALEAALSIDPRSSRARKLLAAAQVRDGDLIAAGQTVAAGLVVAPGDPELLLATAELHCHRGYYQNAIPPLERLLTLRPRDAKATRLLMIAYDKTGQADGALAWLEDRTPPQDRTAEESAIIAGLYASKRDAEKAKASFEAAIKAGPGSREAMRAYLQYNARTGAYDEIYALASQHRINDHDDIMTFVVAAGLLAGDCPDLQLRKTGFTWLSEVINQHPEHSGDAAYRSAMAHYLHRDLDKAEQMFRLAIKLSPTASGPTNGLSWLYCEELERPAQALQLVEAFINSGGRENAQLLDTHGTILLRLDRLSDAKRKFQQCVTAAGQTSTLTAATFHLALALQRSGDASEARQMAREAIRLNGLLSGLSDADRAKLSTILTP